MKSSNIFKVIRTAVLLVGIFLLYGCLKKGVHVDNSTDYQLVVIPSATEVNVGDTVNFDILLIGEIVEAELYIRGVKMPGHKYVFDKRGIYTVYAKREGVKNSDTIEVIVGEGFQKLDLSVVGYMESPSGNRTYIFKTEVGGDKISADIYVDGEKISGTSHSFSPRPDPYLVYAKKEAYITSDTLKIDVRQSSRYKLFLNASATKVGEGTEVSFTAGYVNVEPIRVDAVFYIDGEKIPGNKYKFQKAGEYRVVAKKESYEDSDPLIITVTEKSLSVYVAGFEYSGSRDVAKYWVNDISGEVSLSDGSEHVKANGIAVEKGNVYVGGSKSRRPSEALLWKNGASNSTILRSPGEVNAVGTKSGDIYAAGSDREGHPFYWKNGSGVNLFPGDTPDWFSATGIAIENEDVYISGGSPTVDVSSNAQAFYWKNDASHRFPLMGDGTGAIATGIDVYSENVYVSGAVVSDRSQFPVYWFNGDVVKLAIDAGGFGTAYDIVVTGQGDVYVAGGIYTPVDEKGHAVFWKNGTMKKLSADAVGLGIAVSPGGEVYIAGATWAGEGESAAVYWKIDKTQKIDMKKLTNGKYQAEATAIYLSGTD